MTEIIPNRPQLNIDSYNQMGFDKNGYDKNGFDSKGIDQFGFNAEGIHENGTDYDDQDHDFNGYERVYIQRFLTAFRKFLNLKCTMNVYSVVKFNKDLDLYLEKNKSYLDELILKSLKDSYTLNFEYYSVVKDIFSLNVLDLINRRKESDSLSI
jgi:hypothetical protein